MNLLKTRKFETSRFEKIKFKKIRKKAPFKKSNVAFFIAIFYRADLSIDIA